MTTTPNHDKVTIEVVAAVISRNNHWLLGKRPSHKNHGGLWEFPGGKVEHGESLPKAAERELFEEMGLTNVAVRECLMSLQDPESPYLIRFMGIHIIGEPIAKEHDEIGWFTLETIQSLALAPSDKKFVNNFLAKNA